jgi:hypothetical protein
MLEHVDAQEIAGWKGYELVYGELGNQWDREIQARILEALLRSNGWEDPQVSRPWKDFTPPKTEEQEAAEKQAVVDALDAALNHK